LRSHNFATTNDRKACNMSKVSEFCLEWNALFASYCRLNILCLICISRQYPKIALNLTMMHEFCSIFIWNTVKQGRYLTHMVSSDEIQHDHPLAWQPWSVFLAADQSLGSVCPGLLEPMSRSELAAADQCLKFGDDTPSAAMLTTLNNPVFWFSELGHIGMQVGLSDSVVWTVCRRSVLLDDEVVVWDTANCRQ